MKIEFSEGGAGLREAEALFQITIGARMDEFTERVNADLHEQAIARFVADEARLDELRASLSENSLTRRLLATWQGFFGPSAREQELGRQRIDALERADHAEASLFEAVAEAAQVIRERDALRDELSRLKSGKAPQDTVPMIRSRAPLFTLLCVFSALSSPIAQAEFHVWHDAKGHKHISSIPRDGFTANGTLVRRHNPNSIAYQQPKMIARLNDQALRIAKRAAEKERAQAIVQPTTLRRRAPREGVMNLDQLIDLEKRGGRFTPTEVD